MSTTTVADLYLDRLSENYGESLTNTSQNNMNEVTVPGNTIPELVEYWGSTPDNETAAFVSIDASGRKRELCRKEVLELSKRFAHRLNSLGFKKGDVVCNSLPNSLERVVCEFGIHFLGAVSMNGQVLRSDGEDFLESMKTSQCVAVIVDPNVPKCVYNILLKDVQLECDNSVHSERLPDLKRLLLCVRDDSDSQNDFISSLRNPELAQFRADVSPADRATIMTTSGSTGYSKLVQLSHANICHFGKQVKAIDPLPGGTHFVNCAPLGWAGGYPQWYLSCGVTRYFIDMHAGMPSDIPALLWKIMVQEKIVYGFLTPMFVNAILMKSSWQTGEWKPKTLCLAGQPVKKELLTIIGKLCEAVDVNYGMTECNLVTTHRIVDPSTYTDCCAGYPGYGVKLKVVGPDRQELPQGSTGEILVSSPSLCSGYLSNESSRLDAFTNDGWFFTDDAGFVGSDGKVYIEGRQSDSIHRGAYILYPGWLEKMMKEFPGVRDILIVAVPDTVLYNEICACVVVNDVKGVVAGCLDNESKNNQQPEDVVKENGTNKHKLFSCSLFEKELGQTNKNCLYNNSAESPCEEIIQKDANKPQSSRSTENNGCENDSSKKQTGCSSTKHGETKDTSAQDLNLHLIEKELRSFANEINILHENDAMRMVPKYYVFMESFPVTGNGKVSRKEIRKIAAVALGLE